MKAVQITKPSLVETVDLPKPVPQDGEVLVRVEYVGFCGSDLNTWRGRNALAKMPVIPGHEVGGVIEATGTGVPAEYRPGRVVTVVPYTSCGKCASCRRGRPNACKDNQTLGVQRDGAMRSHIALPWEKILLTDNLSTKECALVEPMSVGFHAVSRGHVTDADTVLVIGCGMVGLGAVAGAARRGATVIAADIDPDKLALARRMGAKHTLDTKTDDVHGKLQEMTGGFGPDVIVEAVGSPVTYRMAVDEVAFTGRVVCIGYSKDDVTFTTRLFVQKELDIRGSRNADPEDFVSVVRYLESGTCPVDALVSRTIGPDEAGKALEEWNENPGKVFRILVRM